MDMEDDVTSQIADSCARMGGGIVEEPEDLIIGLLGGLGFLGGNRYEGSKHGRVDVNGVVQQGPDDLLDEGDGLGGQDRILVGVIGPLDRLAIHGVLPGMEGILGARWCHMLELVEVGREVVGHGDVAGFPGVVPVECQAVVPCTSSVDGYVVQLA